MNIISQVHEKIYTFCTHTYPDKSIGKGTTLYLCYQEKLIITEELIYNISLTQPTYVICIFIIQIGKENLVDFDPFSRNPLNIMAYYC